MEITVLKSSEELGQHDYEVITEKVFLAREERRLLIVQDDDSCLLVRLPE